MGKKKKEGEQLGEGEFWATLGQPVEVVTRLYCATEREAELRATYNSFLRADSRAH
jgi:hypothetical protein